MGKAKYLKRIEELFARSPVVSHSSIERIIKDKRKTEYSKQLVRNLIRKGRIKRLTKGCYSLHDNPQLIVFCCRPAYLGLQDALSFHNLWEQETVPVVITTRKIRSGIRKVLGMNVLIRRIDKRYFFGFEYVQQGDSYFPYSDVEKTFIDMVYFRERLSEEMIRNIAGTVDKKKLDSYLRHYPKRVKNMVLKFLS